MRQRLAAITGLVLTLAVAGRVDANRLAMAQHARMRQHQAQQMHNARRMGALRGVRQGWLSAPRWPWQRTSGLRSKRAPMGRLLERVRRLGGRAPAPALDGAANPGTRRAVLAP